MNSAKLCLNKVISEINSKLKQKDILKDDNIMTSSDSDIVNNVNPSIVVAEFYHF